MSGNTGAAAYQQLQVPQDGIGQAFQYWGGINARRNMEDDARQERAKIRKEEAAKEFEASVPLSDYGVETTGLKDVDQINLEFSNQTFDKAAEYQKKAKEAYRAGNIKEAESYRARLSKINNSFKNIKSAEKSVIALVEDYKKAKQEDKVSELDTQGFDQLITSINSNNYSIDYDENDQPVYKVKVKDEEGNETEKVIPYTASVNTLMSWRTRNDIYDTEKGFVDTTIKSLGKKEFDTGKGTWRTTKQEFSSVEKGARTRIRTYLNDPKTQADVLHQLSGGTVKLARGEKPSQEDLALAEETLLGMIRVGYNESSKTDYISGPEEMAYKWAALRASQVEEEDGASAMRYDMMSVMDRNDWGGISGFTYKIGGTDTTVRRIRTLEDGTFQVEYEVMQTDKKTGEKRPVIGTTTLERSDRSAYSLLAAAVAAKGGKVPSFEKVIASQPKEYRESIPGKVTTQSEIDLENKIASAEGLLYNNKLSVRQVATELKGLFPQADIDYTTKWSRGDTSFIIINGKKFRQMEFKNDPSKVIEELTKSQGNNAAPFNGQ